MIEPKYLKKPFALSVTLDNVEFLIMYIQIIMVKISNVKKRVCWTLNEGNDGKHEWQNWAW